MKLSSLKQRIEELDAKATPAPWESVDPGPLRDCRRIFGPDARYVGVIDNSDGADTYPVDADFIALSRAALPELLRRLLVAEEALKLFSADSSWRINGVCDPNSGRFEGQTIATKALATIRGEEE